MIQMCAAILGALALVAVSLGCGPTRVAAPDSRSLLSIRCSVQGAAIWIDDRLVAEVGEAPDGLRVRPGRHRLEIRHERYHTRYFDVTVRPGENQTIDVVLAEVLD